MAWGKGAPSGALRFAFSLLRLACTYLVPIVFPAGRPVSVLAETDLLATGMIEQGFGA